MEQEEKDKFQPPCYIVCRYFQNGKLNYNCVVHTADAKGLDTALSVMKMLSNNQPGIFILFEGGEVSWQNSEELCYWMVCACQDGRTIPLTSDEKYEDKPGMPFIYDGKGDCWEIPIADVQSAMKD